MSSIGPQLPPHLLNQQQQSDSEDEQLGPVIIGPQIPPELLNRHESENENNSDTIAVPIGPQMPPELLNQPSPRDHDSDEDYTPALPPDLVASRSRPTVSEATISSQKVPHAEENDSDDDIGPKPLPSGVQYEGSDAVSQFIEIEEKRRQNIQDSLKPKPLKRDEWMLAPPSSSELLSTLDPSKLTKSRQFSRSTAPARTVDTSLWTETPAERQQRITDEVSGKKKRAVDADSLSPEEELELRKKRKVDEEIRRGVEEHNRKVRGPALIKTHAKTAKVEDPKDAVIWDHNRDMSIGGRLMDDAARAKMLKDARGLGSRFSSGSRGGYL